MKMSRQMDVRKAFETIKANHGFNFTLKDGQLKVLYTLLNGRDCAGISPTGYEKSICYMVQPLIMDLLNVNVVSVL